MNGYLLDTNYLSELRRASRCDPNVTRWQRDHAASPMFVSVITLMELKLGIALLARRDADAARPLSQWYENRVKPTFAGRILPVTEQIAEHCAALHATRTRPYRDSFIAATAAIHQLEIVTRNTTDFAGCDVPVTNPWQT